MGEFSEGKRQIEKKQTRDRLIRSAMELYARNGFMATTTADVARAAHVAHGTVFLHFSTQEELISTVIEKFGREVSLRMHELAAGNRGLREVLAAHLKGLEEREGFYTHLIVERRLLPPAARNAFTVIQSSVSLHMAQAAEQEMKEGLIEPYPPHLLFNTWMGLIHYYLTNGDLFCPEGSVLERYGQECLDHYMRLISVKNAPEKG